MSYGPFGTRIQSDSYTSNRAPTDSSFPHMNALNVSRPAINGITVRRGNATPMGAFADLHSNSRFGSPNFHDDFNDANIIPAYDVKDLPNDILTLMLTTVVENNSSLYILSESGAVISKSSSNASILDYRQNQRWYPPDVEGRRIELLKRRMGIQNWSNWSESLRNCPQFSPEFWFLLQREMDQSTQRSVTGSIELRESDLETFKITWKEHDPNYFNAFTQASIELSKSLSSGPQLRSVLHAGLTAGVGSSSNEGGDGYSTQFTEATAASRTPGLRRPLTGFGATPFAKPSASKKNNTLASAAQTPWSTNRDTASTHIGLDSHRSVRDSAIDNESILQSKDQDEEDLFIPKGSMLGQGYRGSLGNGSTLGRALFKTPGAPEGGRSQTRFGLLNSGGRASLGIGAMTASVPDTPAYQMGSALILSNNDNESSDNTSSSVIDQVEGTLVVAPESVQSMIFPKQILPAERVLGTGVNPVEKWSKVTMEDPLRITVFGFVPSQASQVLERLSAFGDILRRVDGPTGRWMCVTFANQQSTLRVLGTDGYLKLSDGTLVGVQPFVSEHLMQDISSSLSHAGLPQSNVESVIRSRAAKSSHIFAQPTLAERGVPRQNTCEKIMRFIFNW